MLRLQQRGETADIILARPQAANALSADMLRQFTDIVSQCANSGARVVCLRGEGAHFCAGADLKWMQKSASQSAEENYEEALLLARLLLALRALPMPLVAVVRGACYGGGAGLAAVADICIAGGSARFCFSEVKLGLIPAVITPHVVAAIGARAARRYFLDAAVFSAAEALRLHLAHEVAPDDALDAAADACVKRLLAGGARAQAAVKKLLPAVAAKTLDDDLAQQTARALAQTRDSDEAREGMAAFFEKRRPAWRAGEDDE